MLIHLTAIWIERVGYSTKAAYLVNVRAGISLDLIRQLGKNASLRRAYQMGKQVLASS